jgi:hypothetical protein
MCNNMKLRRVKKIMLILFWGYLHLYSYIIFQHPVAFKYSLHNMHPQGTVAREETTSQEQRTH